MADKVVEHTVVAPVGDIQLAQSPIDGATSIHVMPKAGVMDPVAASAKQAMADAGVAIDEVRTMRKYCCRTDHAVLPQCE